MRDWGIDFATGIGAQRLAWRECWTSCVRTTASEVSVGVSHVTHHTHHTHTNKHTLTHPLSHRSCSCRCPVYCGGQDVCVLPTTCRTRHGQTCTNCCQVVLHCSQTQRRNQRHHNYITGICKRKSITSPSHHGLCSGVVYIEAQFYSQAVLLSATLAHDPKRSSRVWQVARRQLLSLWLSKAGLASHSLSRLLSAEETLPALSLLSLLAEHCQQTGHLDNTLQV